MSYSAFLPSKIDFTIFEQDYFEDNFSHIKALEVESLLILTEAILRSQNENVVTQLLSNGYLKKLDIKFDEVNGNLKQIVKNIRKKRKEMEKKSLSKGITLNFNQVIKKYQLSDFESDTLLLFFMKKVSVDFDNLLSIAKEHLWNTRFTEGLQVKEILSILCNGFRMQLKYLHIFSITSNLFKYELIKPKSYFDDDILYQEFEIDNILFYFILGYQSLIDSDLSSVNLEQPKIDLDQVVLDEGIKTDIIKTINNFLENPYKQKIKEFYGYGTALTLLFYGPSGTGKTMLANALATFFNKKIYHLNLNKLDRRENLDAVFLKIFKQATLLDGIVFIDECEDILKENTFENREFLIAIEKAQCVVILATNSTEEMDPALDRRISLKISFNIPNENERLEIWQRLIPSFVELEKDIDLKKIAMDFELTGGLIKNAIFLAITNSINKKNTEDKIIITNDELLKAILKQTISFDFSNVISKTIKPRYTFNDLKLQETTLDRLKRISINLKNKLYYGVNKKFAIYLECKHLKTAQKCVEAIASECNKDIEIVSLEELLNIEFEEKPKSPGFRGFLVKERKKSNVWSNRTNNFLVVIDKSNYFKNISNNNLSPNFIKLRNNLIESKKIVFFISENKLNNFEYLDLDYYLTVQPPAKDIQFSYLNQLFPSLSKEQIKNVLEQFNFFIDEMEELVEKVNNFAKINQMDLNEKIINFIFSKYKKRNITEILF